MTPKPELPPAPPRTAIVIVTRGEALELERCLTALTGAPAIFVVDSGSGASEGLEERFPHVRFIRLPRHFGLTKALNIGIRAIDEAEFVLFLSAAVEISASAVETLADTLEQQSGVGAVCPLLIGANGTPVDQAGDLPTPAQPHPAMRAARPGESVSSVSNDALLLRHFFLRALRHIDERFGDYGSAPELSRQILRANKTILVHPTITAIIHPMDAPTGASYESDRIVGTSGFLTKHYGFLAGTVYWLKNVLSALVSLRFARLVQLLSFSKIDGN